MLQPDGRNEVLAAVEVAVQAVILVLALVSNSLVLIALVRQLRRKPMSRMYRLMYHLSIADLLVAVFNILPQLIWDITFRYVPLVRQRSFIKMEIVLVGFKGPTFFVVPSSLVSSSLCTYPHFS